MALPPPAPLWGPPTASHLGPSDDDKDRQHHHLAIPNAEPPRGTVDVHLAKDVYATAFTLANNATPSLYSCAPWRNGNMALVWFYLFFIAFTQTFVLVSMLAINPPVVDTRTLFVDCARLDLAYVAQATSLSAEACQRLPIVFEWPASTTVGAGATLRKLEISTYFYNNILTGDAQHTLLQLVCCVWVTVQVYHVDFANVASLLQFRDFIRWLQPQKGETLRRNSWVLLIPLLQFALGVLVVLVSALVTCGTNDPFDVVLNSLAFTFISQVARFFNEPLLRYYATTRIAGLDLEVYGEEPIYYLYSEYSETNSMDKWEDSWYIKDDQSHAGLLSDFHFRHEPGTYPTPNAWLIEALRAVFFCVPVLAGTLCWFLLTTPDGAEMALGWWEGVNASFHSQLAGLTST